MAENETAQLPQSQTMTATAPVDSASSTAATPPDALSTLSPHQAYTAAEAADALGGAAQVAAQVERGALLSRQLKHSGRECSVYYLPQSQPQTTPTPTSTSNSSASSTTPRTVSVAAQPPNTPGSNEGPVGKRAKSTPVQSLGDQLQRRQLLAERHTLQRRLDKLQMVKVYRSKRDVTQLDQLIEKWRQTAISVLRELVKAHPEASIARLMDHYSIPDNMLKYDREADDFE